MSTQFLDSFKKNSLAILTGLALSLGLAVAGPNACNIVPITVVNSSMQSVSIRGGGGVAVVPPKTTQQLAFESNHFYTKCGLIELGSNGQDFQRGMIATASTVVQIHVQENGNLEQIGLTEAGFKLDDYISWWGLGAVLG